MRLPHDTFIALSRALPGTIIGGEDSRPVLPPVIHKALTIPGIVLPVLANNLAFRNGSNYFSSRAERAPSSGSVATTIFNLSSGLWRLSGSFNVVSAIDDPTSGDYLSFITGGVTNSFVQIVRNTVPQISR